ncbi:DUF6777 domain-containing protein [Streptomyces sp. NPDC006527]|uniref:DUF6777 domain-containing protein n=1 Tax=Streptomyces sp. NPDC006527 TaxID=3364749 RepID=UPI0036CD7685
MSVEPPSSGRPTGPPSGPLSGRPQPPFGPSSQPPPGPPAPPPGGTPGGTPPDGTPEPRRPWWRSASRIALLTTALVIVVALALVLTRTDGGGEAGGRDGEVFLQPAAGSGPDPFTDSTATAPTTPPASTAPTSAPAETTNVVRGVDGGAGGLYGGTRSVAACDVEKQIRFLTAEPAKNRAFASVVRVEPSGVPAYLRSLTPVQLRMDTRVTNHGYRDGAATPYQAVLQAGTAVLVDARGEPRVRCACGNPLTRPVAQATKPKVTGESWPSYRPSNVVVVTPAAKVIKVFVLYDSRDDRWFARQRGDTGGKDRPVEPPAHPPKPSASVSLPPAPSSPSEESRSPGAPTPASPSPPPPAPERTDPPASPVSPPGPPSEPATEQPASPEPASPEPPSPEPASPEPASPEPPPPAEPDTQSAPAPQYTPPAGGPPAL